jgi:hypothetical protein
MRRSANPNLEILELAIARLGDWADELVFLGGCATIRLRAMHRQAACRMMTEF